MKTMRPDARNRTRSFLNAAYAATAVAALIMCAGCGDSGTKPTPDPDLNKWYYDGAAGTCAQWTAGEKPSGATKYYTDTLTCIAANSETDPSVDHTLNVVIEPAGAGTVSFSPAPTDGKYNQGTVVTVTITPKAGWEFASWAGTGVEPKYGNNSMAITMNKDDTLTAYVLPKFEMVAVTGGTFRMGCTEEQGDDCFWDESPVHSVTLSDFHIGKFEVTQKQWVAIMGNNPSSFKDTNLMDETDWPMDSVSWDDVKAFLVKLNERTGKTYRMPTESEWEYAAHGGASSKGYKYAGSNNADEVAWYEDNSGDRMHTVGAKAPNELGIYDMSGNVWEWTNDRDGLYTEEAKTNPQGAWSSSTSYRVFRGGGWYMKVTGCRVSDRYTSRFNFREHGLGFRIAH